MATREDIGIAAARVFPSYEKLYEAALGATTSTEIAISAMVGADGKQIGGKGMIGIQCSVKTHFKFINATGDDTADTSDPYFAADEWQEGYIPDGATHLVYYATGAGRICIWEASK